MKKHLLLLMACAIFLTSFLFANERPVLSKSELKIEKALSKIDAAYQASKNFSAAIASYKKVVEKFGSTNVRKVMLVMKTCIQGCNEAYDKCINDNNIPPPPDCEWPWFQCWLNCGGIWGN